MIEDRQQKPQWQRRLTIQYFLQRDKSQNIGEDIGVLSYRTGMSLGTERRVQVLCTGEPMIEIHQDEKGWVTVEVQGVETRGLRVILSGLKDQTITEDTIAPERKRTFRIE